MSGIAGVVGVAQSTYAPLQPLTTAELVYGTVRSALADAGVGVGDLDYVVTASVDLWDGLTASNIAITEVVGAVMRPEVRVAGDSLLAAIHAAMVVAAGHDLVLVVASARASACEHYAVSNWSFDPVYQQTLGLDFLVAAGLQAAAYCQRYGLQPDNLAPVVVKNRLNGSRNPHVASMTPVSAAAVLASPPAASPLSELDCAPLTDGACALVLASPRAARRFRRVAWLQGMGYCQEGHYLGDRRLAEAEALSRAARQAYAMAGIADPKDEFGLVELSEAFSYQEPMWLEGMGLAEPGRGWRLAADGASAVDGRLPVNPSGGLLGGSPPIVAGLDRLAEASLQLWGEAAGRQVKGTGRALVHGSGGPAGQVQAVLVVGAGAAQGV